MPEQLPHEFEWDGKTFQVGKMDIFAQTEIAAKVGPLMVPFAKLFIAEAKAREAAAGDQTSKMDAKAIVEAIMNNFEELAALFAKMPREDRDAILSSCFAVIRKKADGGAVGWQDIWNGKSLQFDYLNELDFAFAAIQAVFVSRLSRFFTRGLPA